MTGVPETGLLQCRVTEWHAVAQWEWDFSEDTCAVCQFSLSECCPKCCFPGPECAPVQGKCSHVYHRHCIEPLDKCPLCRADWEPLVDPCAPTSDGKPSPLS